MVNIKKKLFKLEEPLNNDFVNLELNKSEHYLTKLIQNVQKASKKELQDFKNALPQSERVKIDNALKSTGKTFNKQKIPEKKDILLWAIGDYLKGNTDYPQNLEEIYKQEVGRPYGEIPTQFATESPPSATTSKEPTTTTTTKKPTTTTTTKEPTTTTTTKKPTTTTTTTKKPTTTTTTTKKPTTTTTTTKKPTTTFTTNISTTATTVKPTTTTTTAKPLPEAAAFAERQMQYIINGKQSSAFRDLIKTLQPNSQGEIQWLSKVKTSLENIVKSRQDVLTTSQKELLKIHDQNIKKILEDKKIVAPDKVKTYYATPSPELIKQAMEEGGPDVDPEEEELERKKKIAEGKVKTVSKGPKFEKLKEEDKEKLKDRLMSYLEKKPDATDKQIKEEKQRILKEFAERPPEPVPFIPPTIAPSKIEEVSLLTDLDKYRQAQKKLKDALKKTYKVDEVDTQFDYDKAKYKFVRGQTMNAGEQAIFDEIEAAKKDIEKYEAGAKKQLKEKLDQDKKSVTATQRTGVLGPHLANDSQQAVGQILNKSQEDQIKDIENWYIFDIPDSYTGQGSSIDNPLIRQNQMRERMLLEGSTLFTSLQNYTLQEGPFERKDFYHQHPELTKAGIGRGMFEVNVEETKEQFLQRFNEGNNGLFSQDQSRKEVSDFQNIYQKPARYVGGADYKLDFTNNRGIKHTDKVWINNLNLFFDGANVL